MDRFDAARLGILASAFAAAWIVGWHIQENYLESPWMIGGSVCETTVVNGTEIFSCFGYLPAGAMVLAFVFMMAASPLIVAVNKLDNRE